MVDQVQRVSGGVQSVGPQPVANDALSTVATGTIVDTPATIAAGSTINAKLGRLMLQNDTIIELLTRLVELAEQAAEGDADALG